jgi:hypothetical protein
MYGKKTWGGPVDPFILVKYLDAGDDAGDDPVSSLIIFEWRDRSLVGIPDPDGYGNVSTLPSRPDDGGCLRFDCIMFV